MRVKTKCEVVVVVVTVLVVVEAPLTVPVCLGVVVLMGRPPLVVGVVEPRSSLSSGMGVATGVAEAEGDGVAEDEGVGELKNLVMREVVPLKVKNPTMAKMMIAMTPAKNDFIYPILYTKESNRGD